MELNKIYHEDCIKVMQKIPDASIDLIVTDPPYLISYKSNWREDKGHEFASAIQGDNDPELITNYIKECNRILKDDTAIYMFCSFDKVDFFKNEFQKYFTLKNIIIWEKNNHTAGDLEAQFGKQYEMILLGNKGRRPFNGERLTDVWKFKRVPSHDLEHQNQKPLELIERCITKHSDAGDVVFDGFMGSGTTAIAALNTDRNYIGCEIDPYYFQVAQERIGRNVTQIGLF